MRYVLFAALGTELNRPHLFARSLALMLLVVCAGQPALAQVRLEADINRLGLGSNPKGFAVLDGRLYFAASDERSGAELWHYDAAMEAAVVAVDIVPGPSGSGPYLLTPYAGQLYFRAVDQLWRYDPASGRASLVADLYFAEIVAYAGALYLSANDRVSGTELWRYDPATGETVLIADVRPGPGDAFPSGLTVYEGGLYFRADDGVHGFELWRYDACTGEAGLVLDLLPGAEHAFPEQMAVYAGQLYFVANGPDVHGALWRYDAASGATDRVTAVGPEATVGELLSWADHLYFAGADSAGWEIWRYDAATDAAGPVTTLPLRVSASSPAGFTVYEGKVYFAAEGGESGRELWRYDPVSETTSLVADLNPGPGDLYPGQLTVYAGRLFFTAADGRHGEELWQ